MESTWTNMFGIAPCPKCGSKFRWPTQPVHPKHPDSIICDDCGFVEKMEDKPVTKRRTTNASKSQHE